MGKLISVPEAAELLGVHRATVALYARSGKLQVHSYVGGGQRPRPVFDSDYIEAIRPGLDELKGHAGRKRTNISITPEVEVMEL